MDINSALFLHQPHLPHLRYHINLNHLPPQRLEYLNVVPTECFNKTYVVHAIYFAAATHLYAAWHRGGDTIRDIIATKFKKLSNDHVKDLTQNYFNDSMMRELHQRMAAC